MILTCHLLAGAAIASKIGIIPLALVLAFLSHYFRDCKFRKIGTEIQFNLNNLSVF